MFYKVDWRLYSFLFNVYEHLKKDYDFLLVVVGDTGTGKSRFALQLLETWYRVILDKEVDESLIENFTTSFTKFANNIKNLDNYDMVVLDEGSTALDSKDHMTKLSRNLSKIYDVMRYKRMFSVIVLPNYFGLNKYFREQRLRGLVHIHKRGKYRLFSKKGLTFLNGYNERRSVKSMFLAFPVHTGMFPDYKGVLLKPYQELSARGKSDIIDDLVSEIQFESVKKKTIFELYGSKVKRLLSEGKSQNEIASSLGIGVASVNRTVQDLRKRGLIEL